MISFLSSQTTFSAKQLLARVKAVQAEAELKLRSTLTAATSTTISSTSAIQLPPRLATTVTTPGLASTTTTTTSSASRPPVPTPYSGMSHSSLASGLPSATASTTSSTSTSTSSTSFTSAGTERISPSWHSQPMFGLELPRQKQQLEDRVSELDVHFLAASVKGLGDMLILQGMSNQYYGKLWYASAKRWLNGRDNIKAVESLERACSYHYQSALIELAEYYFEGTHSCVKNIDRAFELIRKAASYGNLQAKVTQAGWLLGRDCPREARQIYESLRPYGETVCGVNIDRRIERCEREEEELNERLRREQQHLPGQVAAIMHQSNQNLRADLMQQQAVLRQQNQMFLMQQQRREQVFRYNMFNGYQ